MVEPKKRPGMILYREELGIFLLLDPVEGAEAIRLLTRRFMFQEEPKTENPRIKLFLDIALPKQEADEEKYKAKQLQGREAGIASGEARRTKANDRSTKTNDRSTKANDTSTETNDTSTDVNKQKQKQNNKQNIKQNNIYISSSSASEKPDLESDFNQFWNVYPRHEDRAKALKAYAKARKAGTSQQDLEEGAKRYSQMIQAERTEKQFIKLGATWLNGRCWENEYQAAAAAVPDLINSDGKSYDELQRLAELKALKA